MVRTYALTAAASPKYQYFDSKHGLYPAKTIIIQNDGAAAADSAAISLNGGADFFIVKQGEALTLDGGVSSSSGRQMFVYKRSGGADTPLRVVVTLDRRRAR